MSNKIIVKITSKIKHDYLKVGDEYMGVYDAKENNVQFVLKNGYPTLYGQARDSFNIESLSKRFGEEEFSASRGKKGELYTQ